MDQLAFKIIVVGNPNTGKTQLVEAIFNRPFEHNYYQTMEPIIHNYHAPLGDTEVQIQIWDCPGQRGYFDFNATPILQGTHVAIIVYSLDDYKSFEAIQDWNNLIISNIGLIPILIVGNKMDLYESEMFGESLVDKGKHIAEVYAKVQNLPEPPFTTITAMKQKDAYRVFGKAIALFKFSQQRQMAELKAQAEAVQPVQPVQQAYDPTQQAYNAIPVPPTVQAPPGVGAPQTQVRNEYQEVLAQQAAAVANRQLSQLQPEVMSTDKFSKLEALIINTINAINTQNYNAIPQNIGTTINRLITNDRHIRDNIEKMSQEQIAEILYLVRDDPRWIESKDHFLYLLLYKEFAIQLSKMSVAAQDLERWSDQIARVMQRDPSTLNRFHALPQKDQEQILNTVCVEKQSVEGMQDDIYSRYRNLIYQGNR